jgi:hypothetical protein
MRVSNHCAAVIAGGLVAAFAGCGGGTTNPDPGPVPTPTSVATCTQTVVDSGNGSTSARTFYYKDFSFPDSARLDLTVDWTLPASPIGVYLVSANTCNSAEEFNARSCSFLLRSEPSSVKPRKLSLANAAAGNYRWIIANFNSDTESVSYQVVMSKGAACAPLATAPPAASTRAADERVERARPMP